MKTKTPFSDYILKIVVHILVGFSLVITLYPILYTVSMSISNPISVAKNEIFLFPKGFSFESYKMVFRDSTIWQAYGNTLWYTLVGTTINILMTVVAAYPLSRKHLMMFVTFTMFFNGGLIPFFILVNDLGLYGSRWAVIVPVAINTWNLIVCRSFFENIPESLEEAANIDGANQFIVLSRVFIPLSMPVIAVLILFYAVGHWNAYFNALLFLPDKAMQPLQTYLREVLILSSTSSLSESAAGGMEKSLATIQLKYSVIVVSILPIITVYPFLQKYFVSGVMIGAVKG